MNQSYRPLLLILCVSNSVLWLLHSAISFANPQHADASFISALLPMSSPWEFLTRISLLVTVSLALVLLWHLLGQKHSNAHSSDLAPAHLFELLSSISEAVVICDARWNIQHLNSVVEEWTGLPLSNLRGQALGKALPLRTPESGQPIDPPYRAHATELPFKDRDFLFLDSKDQELSLCCTLTQIHAPSGELVNNILLIRNVTEARRLQREVRESQTLLKAVVDQSPIPIVIVAAQGERILAFNQACLDFLGISKQMLVGKSMHEVDWTWKSFSPDGRIIEPEDTPIARAVRGQATAPVEIKLEDSQGKVRFTMATGSPIHDDEGRLIAGLAIFPDITKLKETEARLRKNMPAEEFIEIETHVRSLAHNLNNVLGTILGSADLLQKHLPDRPQARQHSQIILEAAEKASDMTQGILDYIKTVGETYALSPDDSTRQREN